MRRFVNNRTGTDVKRMHEPKLARMSISSGCSLDLIKGEMFLKLEAGNGPRKNKISLAPVWARVVEAPEAPKAKESVRERKIPERRWTETKEKRK